MFSNIYESRAWGDGETVSGPGSTLEYTNAKSHELQEIAKQLEEIKSVTSLAGYEVLTEGRGSNAGTCIINLKPWDERKLTSKQIIEELEEFEVKPVADSLSRRESPTERIFAYDTGNHELR